MISAVLLFAAATMPTKPREPRDRVGWHRVEPGSEKRWAGNGPYEWRKDPVPSDAAFEQVAAGSLEDNPCSPSIDDDWEFVGIRIAAPARVSLSQKGHAKKKSLRTHPRLIVCGVYQLKGNYRGLGEDFAPHIGLVAASVRTGQVFRGPASDPHSFTIDGALVSPDMDPVESPSAPRGGEPGDSNRLVTGYFNPDIGAALALPRKEDAYLVHAELGEYSSNVVRVEVTETESPFTTTLSIENQSKLVLRLRNRSALSQFVSSGASLSSLEIRNSAGVVIPVADRREVASSVWVPEQFREVKAGEEFFLAEGQGQVLVANGRGRISLGPYISSVDMAGGRYTVKTTVRFPEGKSKDAAQKNWSGSVTSNTVDVDIGH